MVRFGRVEGIVEPFEESGETRLRLTVYLETGSRLTVVREAVVRPLRPLATAADLLWHADQLTQETIGTDLAEEGWEAIGAGEAPLPEPGALAKSPAYAVRNLSS